jgi:hypothetical protein
MVRGWPDFQATAAFVFMGIGCVREKVPDYRADFSPAQQLLSAATDLPRSFAA